MFTSEQESAVWMLVHNTVDKTISAIYVNLYLYKEQYDWSDSPLQFVFQDESVLFLDSNSNGERLRTTGHPWQDPFQGKLDPNNQQYVNQHGRWIQQEVTTQAPYNELVGEKIQSVHPIINQFGTLCGVRFKTQAICLNFIVEFDECRIIWGEADLDLRQRGLSIMEAG